LIVEYFHKSLLLRPFNLIQPQFIYRYCRGDLAGVFFIIGFAFGEEFAVYNGADGK
jgi:hypothetical protein